MVTNKVIIVTGAASGMGKATALTLAGRGAAVVLGDLDEAKGLALEQEIMASGGRAKFVRINIAVEADVIRLVDTAVETFGKLDGAFNNAGIEMAYKPLHELSLADWSKRIDINLTGTFLCMKYEIAAMLKSGGGAIVNTSSILGQVGATNSSDYSASKHGVSGLTRSAANDFGADKIRVNAILPGTIETPMVMERAAGAPEFAATLEAMRQRHALKRFGKPQEIANAVAWLLSDEASFITGATLPVDGGYLAS